MREERSGGGGERGRKEEERSGGGGERGRKEEEGVRERGKEVSGETKRERRIE